MARTMTDEQERDIRVLVDVFDETPLDSDIAALLAELEAERAAHEETKAELEQVRDANMSVRVCKDHTSDVLGDGCLVCELTAIKARLARADAVCESCGSAFDPDEGGFCSWYNHDALAAWRAAK